MQSLKTVEDEAQFERTWREDGLVVDTYLDKYELRRIPVRFRNVNDEFLRQECCIPDTSPTLKTFWNNLSETATYEEIDDLINKTLKHWEYLPVKWKQKYSRVELKPSSSTDDELVVFLDDSDSWKKARYAPFDEYNPYSTYDRDHLGRAY